MSAIMMRVICMSVLTFSVTAAQADRPLQLAFWPPDMQLVNQGESVTGLRLAVYGRNQNMSGLDLGFCNESTGSFKGLAFGLANMAEGSVHGLQWTWIYSKAGNDLIGWQSGLLTMAGDESKGIQTSAVALNKGKFTGVQFSWVYNYQEGDISGVQLALVNRSASVNGVQLGLVNLTENMHGIQIGLWNQIDAKDTWQVIPIVNFKF